MADAFLRLVAHPLAVVTNVLGQSAAPFHEPDAPSLRRDSGFTGGLPANLGGISMSALVMSTATGFKSLACASSPSRCASSGIEPPPQNGSYTGGGLPSVQI